MVNDRLMSSSDPATRARARGRAITSALARLVRESDEGRYWVDMRSVLSGGQPRYNAKAGAPSLGTNDVIPDLGFEQWEFGNALKHVWHYHTPIFSEDRPNA